MLIKRCLLKEVGDDRNKNWLALSKLEELFLSAARLTVQSPLRVYHIGEIALYHFSVLADFMSELNVKREL